MSAKSSLIFVLKSFIEKCILKSPLLKWVFQLLPIVFLFIYFEDFGLMGAYV